MAALVERSGTSDGLATYRELLGRIPDALDSARAETERLGIARTAEGKLSLSYILAARNLLSPLIADIRAIDSALIAPIGGMDYNPSRYIDSIGGEIVFALGRQSSEIKHLWIRTEEEAKWEPSQTNGLFDQAERFAIVDPLDMTSSIPKGDRTQTTGIAVYARDGSLKALGIASLVDNGLIFLESDQTGTFRTFTSPDILKTEDTPGPLRVATLARRMHALRNLPILQQEHGVWVQDCASGYATLSLVNGTVDTVIDPVKGNPWYEFGIWGRAAQELGFPVTDPDGNRIDMDAIMRYSIEKNPDDSFRIRFVMSRNEAVHERALTLLVPGPRAERKC